MMQHHVEIGLTDTAGLFEIAISDQTGEYFYTIMAANEVEAVEIAKQAHLN